MQLSPASPPRGAGGSVSVACGSAARARRCPPVSRPRCHRGVGRASNGRRCGPSCCCCCCCCCLLELLPMPHPIRCPLRPRRRRRRRRRWRRSSCEAAAPHAAAAAAAAAPPPLPSCGGCRGTGMMMMRRMPHAASRHSPPTQPRPSGTCAFHASVAGLGAVVGVVAWVKIAVQTGR
jgi:hypothetical protein